jgi:hypothetical protein
VTIRSSCLENVQFAVIVSTELPRILEEQGLHFIVHDASHCGSLRMVPADMCLSNMS